MNCPYCGKKNQTYKGIDVYEGRGYAGTFCDRACLRAWLGPDPEVKRVLGELQKAIRRPE